LGGGKGGERIFAEKKKGKKKTAPLNVGKKKKVPIAAPEKKKEDAGCSSIEKKKGRTECGAFSPSG